MAKRRRKSATSTNGTGPTKAQAIRDAFKELGRKARLRDVILHAADKGIQVSSSHVIAVRNAMRKRGAGRRKLATVRGRSSGNAALTVEQLMEAKALADRLGGVEAVRKAMELLAELR